VIHPSRISGAERKRMHAVMARIERSRQATLHARRLARATAIRQAAYRKKVGDYHARMRQRDALEARQRAKETAALRGDYGISVQAAARRIAKERAWRMTRPEWARKDPRTSVYVTAAYRHQTEEYLKERAHKEAIMQWGKKRPMYYRTYGESMFNPDMPLTRTREERARSAYAAAHRKHDPSPGRSGPFPTRMANVPAKAQGLLLEFGSHLRF
jgi:hypothetical protein